MPGFGPLLDACVAYYGGKKQDLARALHIPPSGLSRLHRPGARPSTELCLRLASLCGQPATVVLRAAGRDDVARVLEQLYGAGPDRRFAPPLIGPQEREHLAHWRQLRPDEARALTLLLTRTLAGRTLRRPDRSLPTVQARRRAR